MLEPDPANRSHLARIFALNGGWPSNVIAVEQGLWKESATLDFAACSNPGSALAGLSGTEAAIRHKISYENARLIQVPMLSLADLVEKYGIERLDFVKMDIEGAEIEAVQGALEVMERFKPRFAIASYHWRDGAQTSDALEKLFRQARYHARTGFFEHRTTWAAPLSDETAQSGETAHNAA